MAYPKDKKERARYWLRQVEYAAKRMEPLFKVSETLTKMYLNEPVTYREKNQEVYGRAGIDEVVTSRTKNNLIFSWIEQSIANMLERSPSFRVSPQRRESAPGAPIVGSVLDYYYRETGQLRTDERVLLDAFLCPYGVKKLGWTADLEWRAQQVASDIPEYDFGDEIEQDLYYLLAGVPTAVTRDQDHEAHIDLKVAALQDPTLNIDEDAKDLVEDNIRRHRAMLNTEQPDVNTEIKLEMPFGVRWNPIDFVIDPVAENGLQDARWIAFRWRKPLSEVRANPNYKIPDDLKGTERMEGAPDPEMAGAEDDFNLVVGWEIWARNFLDGRRRKNLLLVVCNGCEEPLRYEEEWPYTRIEDYPAELLSFQQSPISYFSKPTLSLAGADNVQSLVNEILDSFLSIVRKQKNLMLYDSDLIAEDEVDNMLYAPDMSAFPVPGMAKAAAPPIQAVKFGQVADEKGSLLNLSLSLFDRAAGTPQPQRQDQPDSATEASIVERRTSARESRRSSLLAEMQVRTARKFWQLTTQFRPERLFEINAQANQWAEIDDATARGEYDFKIDIGSQSGILALERKQWSDLLNLFAGLSGLFQQLYQKSPNIAALAERLLRRGFNEQSPEEILPMLANRGEQASIEEQAMINQLLQGTPGQAPTEGPSLTGNPTEVESEDRVGAALPRLFREPGGANSPIQGAAQAV